MALIVAGIQFDELTADPSTPSEGEAWYNTTDKVLRIYRNGQVQEVVQVSGAPSDGNVPVWVAANNRWEPAAQTGGGSGGGLPIWFNFFESKEDD